MRPYCLENQLNCCEASNVDDDDNDDGNNNNNYYYYYCCCCCCDTEDPAQDFYFVNASDYKLSSLTL